MPQTVRAALDAFLTKNGFTTDAYTAPTVEIPMRFFTVRLPNTDGRKKVVPWHDLHHVATGYGTDLVGEAEIGAWELRAGCTTVAAWVYNLMAVATGLFLAPVRVTRAFRDAKGQTTLYRLALGYDEALALPVEELRSRMGLPPAGAATRPARLHAAAAQRA